MKKIFFVFHILCSHALMAQIDLKECIEAGLANKTTIKSAKAEVMLANLQNIDSKSKYLPQIELAYDYRYNPIIATQIVPVGQFNPVPTDELRAIQFGTNWQQNAGISLYQPLIDLAIQNRIKEGKLNERMSALDLQKAEDELKYEIVKSYSKVFIYGFQVDEAIADTIRSFQSLEIIRSKFGEDQILKTELNTALLNHNNNLTGFRTAFSVWMNEKIYLHFLTALSLERILDERFESIPEKLFANINSSDETSLDSLLDFQMITMRETLANQQIKTDRKKYSPTAGLQGFLGANQFSESFDPFLNDSWFGNSYVGLSIRIPVFSPDKSINKNKQIRMELNQLAYEREELNLKMNKDLVQNKLETERLTAEVNQAKINLSLLNENIKIFQHRVEAGQLAIRELNVEESEIQKITSRLRQLNESLNRTKIDGLYINGTLSKNLKTL